MTYRHILVSKGKDHPKHLSFVKSGLQKVDGMAGALIIRCPKNEDPHRKLYDYDLPSHVLVVQDLQHNTAETVYPGVQKRGLDQLASTYLINGRGHYVSYYII